MAAITRALMGEAVEFEGMNSSKQKDAALAVYKHQFEAQMQRLAKEKQRFELLDDVFKAFRDTNKHQGRHYSLQELVQNAREYKMYFGYEHLSVPYLATVRMQRGRDCNIVDIKLANDGFWYVTKDGRMVSRHKSNTWISLPADVAFFSFEALPQAVRGLDQFVGYRLWYNFEKQRVDIEFFPEDVEQDGAVKLRVTYEPGYPFEEDGVAIHPL
jgi:hypothetical protein